MTTPTDGTPATTEAWTVGRILDWTTQHLKKNGSETPRLDAELLLAHCRGCARIQLYVQFAEIVSDEQRSRMRDLVKRRAAHEPVAYLIGYREFYSLRFEVSRDTLIPRPETESLVLEVTKLLTERPAARLLDIGTGSGCIAIAATKNLPRIQTTAVDLSPAALAVARRNAATHGVADRIEFLESDLFAAVPPEERFDVIATNPPYVADEEMDELPPDVRLHEPHSALKAGPKGMTVIARIIPAAIPFLAEDGWLLIELDPAQVTAATGLLKEQGYRNVRSIKDMSGDQRIVAAQRPVIA